MNALRNLLGILLLMLGLVTSAHPRGVDFLFDKSSFSYQSRSALAAVAELSVSNGNSRNSRTLNEYAGLQELIRLEEEFIEQGKSLQSVPHLVADEILYDKTRKFACVVVHCIFLPSLRCENFDFELNKDRLWQLGHSRVYSMRYDELTSRWMLGSSDNPVLSALLAKLDSTGAIIISSNFNLTGLPKKFEIIENARHHLLPFFEAKYAVVAEFFQTSLKYQPIVVSFERLDAVNHEVINSAGSALESYMYTLKIGDFMNLQKIALRAYRNKLKAQAEGITQTGIERFMRRAYNDFGKSYGIAVQASIATKDHVYICLLTGRSISGAWNTVAFRLDLTDIENGFIEKVSLTSDYLELGLLFRKVYDVWISEFYRGV
jgi:hypothetical protein